MAPTEDINTLAGRLATFEVAHRLPKRRSSAAKKKGPAAVSWPHESPAPEEVGATLIEQEGSHANDQSYSSAMLASTIPQPPPVTIMLSASTVKRTWTAGTRTTTQPTSISHFRPIAPGLYFRISALEWMRQTE